MAESPDEGAPALGFADRLILIGRAGGRAQSYAEAATAIANACVGIAGCGHVVLCPGITAFGSNWG